MDMMFAPYARFFDFSGRSTRTEYWLYMLFIWTVMAVLFILGGGMDVLAGVDPEAALMGAATSISFLLMGIFLLVSFIPSLAVTVRRFHDAGFSGWVYLALIFVSMIPLVGLLASLGMLIITVLPSVQSNKWGDNPHDDWMTGDNYGYERPEAAARPEGVRYR